MSWHCTFVQVALYITDYPSYGTVVSTMDLCPKCAGALYCCRVGDDRRFCVCGYYRAAPARRSARLLVAGETTFRRLEGVLDRLSARIDVGWIVVAGSKDAARRWAVLREVNITEPTGYSAWGQVQFATHVVQFGPGPDHALLAEDAGKPVRLLKP